MRASAPRRRMKRCHYDRSHPLEPRGPHGDRLIVTVRSPRSWVVEHSLLRSMASVTPRYEFIQLCDLVVGDAAKGVAEPGLRIDTIQLGGFMRG